MLNSSQKNGEGVAGYGKTWQFKPLDEPQCRLLAEELQIPLAIATLLHQRGFSDGKVADTFLRPSLSHLPAPLLMKGMRTAVTIISEAINNRRPIALFGDYDVDGITGSALLALFLRELGLEVASHQPDRLTEGYGLNAGGLEILHDRCCRATGDARGAVLITVDCGITNTTEIEVARQMGFSVIVTDHHQVPPILPAADAILNPLQPGCDFPFKQLAGVGVAFYLCMGIRQHLLKAGFWPSGERPNLKKYLDLVAIGTVADMVPLLDVNRILVKAGLETAALESRPGLRSLADIAGIHKGITPEDIAYRIGPRLNAAGRMGTPEKAMELLLTDNMIRGRQLAAELDDANRNRKLQERLAFEEAFGMAETEVRAGKKSLVLAGNNWHTGIIGIVASRLAEQFWRPVVLLAVDDREDGVLPAKGSGRTVPGLNLYELISGCGDLLEKYGGHDSAAGLTIKKENIGPFRKRLEQLVSEKLGGEELAPRMWIDCRAGLDDIFSPAFLKSYSQLAPFGQGNPEPVFHVGRIKLASTRVVGGTHLKFTVSQPGEHHGGIGFGLGGLAEQLKEKEHELAVNLRLNDFRGAGTYELNLVSVNSEPPDDGNQPQIS